MQFELPLRWWAYLLVAFASSFVVRIAVSVMAAVEAALAPQRPHGNVGGWKRFREYFWKSFCGFGFPRRYQNDYGSAFVLGFLEFIGLPIAILAGRADFIGAWFTLKTLPQWARWKRDRSLYNRFLMANALVLFLAYGIAHWSVISWSPAPATPATATVQSKKQTDP